MRRCRVLVYCGLGIMAHVVTLVSAQTVEQPAHRSQPPSLKLDDIGTLIQALNIEPTDTLAVISNNRQLIKNMYHASPAQRMISVVSDKKLCEAIQREVADEKKAYQKELEDQGKDQKYEWIDAQKSKKSMTVLCQKPESYTWKEVTVIFLDIPLDTHQSIIGTISHRIAQLADGVRVVSTVTLADDIPSLRFEQTQSTTLQGDKEVLIHSYFVKEPTPAEILEEVYCGISGFSIGSGETDVICKGGGNATYGEILFESAEKLFTDIVPLSATDTFYDLGCGVGKLVEWVYLATPTKKSVGIELSKTRYHHAHKIAQQVRADIVPSMKKKWVKEWGDNALKKTVEFRHENILESDMSDATVIFVCATCFPDSCMQALTEIFADLHEGTRIISLKEFPRHSHMHRTGSVNLKMTWSRDRGSEVYLYTIQKPRLVDVLDIALHTFNKNQQCAMKTEETTTYVAADLFYTSEAAKNLFQALHVSSNTYFIQLGVSQGTTLAQAFLTTSAPIIQGISYNQHDKEVASSLLTIVKDTLQEEEVYAKLYKELSSKPVMQRLPSIDVRDHSFKISPLIQQNGGDATTYQNIACLISLGLSQEKDWQILTHDCTTLPEGTHIATVKELHDPALVHLQSILMETAQHDIQTLHIYKVQHDRLQQKSNTATSQDPQKTTGKNKR